MLGFFEEADVNQVWEERLGFSGPSGTSQVWSLKCLEIPDGGEKRCGTGPGM